MIICLLITIRGLQEYVVILCFVMPTGEVISNVLPSGCFVRSLKQHLTRSGLTDPKRLIFPQVFLRSLSHGLLTSRKSSSITLSSRSPARSNVINDAVKVTSTTNCTVKDKVRSRGRDKVATPSLTTWLHKSEVTVKVKDVNAVFLTRGATCRADIRSRVSVAIRGSHFPLPQILLVLGKQQVSLKLKTDKRVGPVSLTVSPRPCIVTQQEKVLPERVAKTSNKLVIDRTGTCNSNAALRPILS